MNWRECFVKYRKITSVNVLYQQKLSFLVGNNSERNQGSVSQKNTGFFCANYHAYKLIFYTKFCLTYVFFNALQILRKRNDQFTSFLAFLLLKIFNFVRYANNTTRDNTPHKNYQKASLTSKVVKVYSI